MTLEPDKGNVQYCHDHRIAWFDGSDCWGAGINGIDACRITFTEYTIEIVGEPGYGEGPDYVKPGKHIVLWNVLDGVEDSE